MRRLVCDVTVGVMALVPALALGMLVREQGWVQMVRVLLPAGACALGAVLLAWAVRDRAELHRLIRSLARQVQGTAPPQSPRGRGEGGNGGPAGNAGPSGNGGTPGNAGPPPVRGGIEGEMLCHDLDAYRLSRPAIRVATDLAAQHGTLVRQLRDQLAACQRLDVAQRAAQAAQHRAEAILHGLHDAVLVTNLFAELLQANREATRVFGVDFESARGRPLQEAIRDASLAQILAQLVERAQQAGPQTEQVSFAVQDKPRVFQANVARVTDPAGVPLGVVLVLHDITAEKAAQSRTSEFVSAVSHEIKTPLTSVKAYVELLADGDLDGDPEAQRKYLDVIESEANRMSRMLDGLLDLARIESGVVRIDKCPLSLNDVLERIVQLMSAAARDKGLTLESRLTPLYLNIDGDADMLNRVVANLVSNAIKYTPAGGRITLRSHMRDNHAVFEVQDTGHGIPAEAMDKLFQKFYRVEQNARVAPGTGLGLALVKHLVEHVHGGAVEVDSQVGRGSTFRVLLPLAGSLDPRTDMPPRPRTVARSASKDGSSKPTRSACDERTTSQAASTESHRIVLAGASS